VKRIKNGHKNKLRQYNIEMKFYILILICTIGTNMSVLPPFLLTFSLKKLQIVDIVGGKIGICLGKRLNVINEEREENEESVKKNELEMMMRLCSVLS